jgi:hypothetical protein
MNKAISMLLRASSDNADVARHDKPQDQQYGFNPCDRHSGALLRITTENDHKFKIN